LLAFVCCIGFTRPLCESPLLPQPFFSAGEKQTKYDICGMWGLLQIFEPDMHSAHPASRYEQLKNRFVCSREEVP
jgi:hypothetical protein